MTCLLMLFPTFSELHKIIHKSNVVTVLGQSVIFPSKSQLKALVEDTME